VAELELEPRFDGDTATIIVRGEIDVATAPQLRELLHDLVQRGSKQIVLDCRELRFLDSSGIGLLVATSKRLGDGGSVVVDSPPDHVRKVLELTGVAGELSLRP
jgi:anti-sigma B factor antagonist